MKDQMEADDFHVVAADETIAALWENCAAAKSELREQTTQVGMVWGRAAHTATVRSTFIP